MVSSCWVHGLVVHVAFWSSPDPMGPHKGAWTKNFVFLVMCPRGLIMISFEWVHGLVVHVQLWLSQDALGPQKGTWSKNFGPSCFFFSTQSICPRHLIMVLSCWVCGPVVHVQVGSCLNTQGPQKGAWSNNFVCATGLQVYPAGTSL